MNTRFAPCIAIAPYALRLAKSAADLHAVQRLRFEVFNLELHEGLAASYQTRLDADPFDAVCEHLMVEDVASGQVVGTYRMQTGAQAALALGYYCAQEFEFDVYEALRGELLELGRACIASEHRSMQVLSLLWRGIADYASAHGARYLFGCSSLTSQDSALGAAAYAALLPYLAPAPYQTQPLQIHQLQTSPAFGGDVRIPKLLSAYLSLGAWICGPPALDCNFGTIDFLTCLDLQSPHMAQRRKRFGITP
jgi:putative hemolysin